MLFHGVEGVSRDPAAGRAWIGRAAQLSNAEAQRELARRLEQDGAGAGGARAVALYETVAEQGDLDVQTMLGERALRSRDGPRALYWFRKAAALGSCGRNREA
ncbi:MAG: hypothetical protein ACK4R8_00095 [Thiobacillus sp.]